MQLPAVRPKIRRGQLWKKKDTGLVVELTGRNGKGHWSYKKLSNGCSGKQHSVFENDLYRFWEKISG